MTWPTLFVMSLILTQPKSQEDLEKQIQADKINYLVWSLGVAVKELQAEVDKLNKREAS